ncbi:prepilin peptidase [Roseomonas frigidaquae]|uniref:Prepilin peptidase n=1 Tax=Falsiroseomonas frigidaquae TaxID=487318 RepID=A0ABX1F1I2_9PROT|nr:prepilin peptidase [Falsiroseomonas frigidaquae]
MDVSVQLLLILPLLAYACWRDLSARMIPDAVSLLLAGIGILSRLSLGWDAALVSLASAAVLFLVLLGCAMRGWLGGGDVKLAGAVALGFAPAATWDFVFATTLAGGLLGVLYLAGPSFAPRLAPSSGTALLPRLAAIESWRLRRRGPLPYGFAIAAGALAALLANPQ